MRRTSRWILGTAIGTAAGLFLAVLAAHAYQLYWLRGAEAAVSEAADALARGESVSALEVSSLVDRPALSRALRSGYELAGFDVIGFGFRAYEIKLRVTNGDQYNFDAIHDEGAWHLDCCVRHAASDLP